MILGKPVPRMTSFILSLTLYVFMFIICLGFGLLFVLMDVTAEFGTTPNLKQIVIGRCFEYVALANLNPR